MRHERHPTVLKYQSRSPDEEQRNPGVLRGAELGCAVTGLLGGFSSFRIKESEPLSPLSVLL